MSKRLLLSLCLLIPHLSAVNRIVTENERPGTGDWNSGTFNIDRIAGFTSRVSVTTNDTLAFYVSASSAQFEIQIYRMGWYKGAGGRLVASSGALTQVQQPACTSDPESLMISCANWSAVYTVQIPADWVTGVYLAKFIDGDAGAQPVYSTVPFVVRDDTGTEPLVQIPFTTYQAYNLWGGRSLYHGSYGKDNLRSHKVSYDRPYWTPVFTGGPDYSLVRWLEKQGYDVAYSSSIDTHERFDQIVRHKSWMTVAHDEYWSKEMRDNVEAARDAGVNLAFLAGNEIYWQVRFEASALGANR
ncbi:MAG TPA: N,N-dimethylformamidase beta subunit family domain-containing protein, partial [Terriglobales bacterium]|nr:N,N-dimethylformamidase beta subunit family domain-containing protein [Terriglobales bacterium]